MIANICLSFTIKKNIAPRGLFDLDIFFVTKITALWALLKHVVAF